MKKSRILPGAAGIIALTATMGFVDGQRKIEAEGFSRERVVLVRTFTEIPAEGATPRNETVAGLDISAYLVEIKRGDKSKKVLIDALTGKILVS